MTSVARPLTASIVVACRNEKNHIELLLKTIFEQELHGVEIDIIIADGMSDDGTRDILRQATHAHANLRVLDNPRRFVSPGLNLAIAASSSEFILRMDAHTEYAPDYVQRCLQVLLETGADNVGGPARTRSEGYSGQTLAAAYHSPFATGGSKFHNRAYEGLVDTVPYGCWRKETLERLGMFDESLVRNQDDELNLRIHRSGGKIWQSPGIVSWYQPRKDLGALWRQYFQYGFWKVKVIRKHRIPASWRHLVPAAFVMALLLFPLAAAFAALFQAQRAAEALLYLWSGLLILYAMACLGASVITAQSSRWRFLPLLPFVFAVYHLSYGQGFLFGLLHWRRSPDLILAKKDLFTQLSR